MEEEKREEEKPEQPQPERVFFDQPTTLSQDEGGNRKVIIPIILLIVILAIAGGWFLFKGRQGEFTASPSPTPSLPEIVEGSPSPSPSVDKSTIDIEVLNGTGIAGEASFLEEVLKKLGYASIKSGNAQSQDNTQTQVSFGGTVAEEIKTEIKTELEKLYKEVKVGSTLTSGQFEVRIITGLRKGATPKPTATATPKASPSPSPTKTASPTPTPTPTPTAATP